MSASLAADKCNPLQLAIDLLASKDRRPEMTDAQTCPRKRAQEILFAWFAFQRSLGARINVIDNNTIDTPASTELVVRLLADLAAQLENFPEIIAGHLPYHDDPAENTALAEVLHQECMGIHIRLQTLSVPARWINPLDNDNVWPQWKRFCDLVAEYISRRRLYGEFIGKEQNTSQWRELLLRMAKPSLGKIINPPRIFRWLGMRSTWVKLAPLPHREPKSLGPLVLNETDNEFLQRQAYQRWVAEGPMIQLEGPRP